MRLILLALLLVAMAAGCGRRGVTVYPPAAEEPGTEPGSDIAGASCTGSRASCTDVAPGSGEPLKAYALVTARIIVDDVVEPPVRVGPRQLTFLHPPIGQIEFMGRERDLSVNMFGDQASAAVGGAFFERTADALVGSWLVGMRRGGSRRVVGRYTGTLDRVELTPGRDRAILIELLDFCYPTVRLRSGMRWSWFDGSGSPVSLQPALSVTGCGSP
jgi:predicted small lipoprotein YifL